MGSGAVELRNTLVSQFGVELPATATFDYPTVAALAAFIVSQGAATATEEQTIAPGDGGLDSFPADAEGGLNASAPTAVNIDSIRCDLLLSLLQTRCELMRCRSLPLVRLYPSSGYEPLAHWASDSCALGWGAWCAGCGTCRGLFGSG